MNQLSIEGRIISPDHPPYVIAEMSGNHNGDINRAFALIEAAKEAGVDAIKLQTYTADTLTLDCDRPEFFIKGGLWNDRHLHDLYQEAHTPWEWHEALFAKARCLGLTIFSSPFDPTAIDFLESLNCPAYKIASFELIDLPLIAKAAQTGKPLVISTGMGTLGEIEEAVLTARKNGCPSPILLCCTSGYPTPLCDVNLRRIPHLAQAFSIPVGLSDHTQGIAVSIAAVALGANVIEKHFTLKRAEGGVDAEFSLEEEELKTLNDACKDAWRALGKVAYTPSDSEAGGLRHRRSLYIVADVKEGERFTSANTRSIRPGLGLPPKHLPFVLGKKASRDLSRGTPLGFDMICFEE